MSDRLSAKEAMKEFVEQIALEQRQSLEKFKRDFAALQAKQVHQNTYRSGRSLFEYAQAASVVLEEFVDSGVNEAEAFVAQFDVPVAEIARELRTRSIQLPLQIVELEKVSQMGAFRNHVSLKQDLLNLMSEAKERCDRKIRKLEIGFRSNFDDVGKTVNHNSVHAHNINGPIQQGGQNQSVYVLSEVDKQTSHDAIDLMEGALRTLDGYEKELEDIKSDLVSLRAQLSKTNPSKGVLKELGQSVRNVSEGAIGGALGSQFTEGLSLLFRSLGS